MKKYNKELSETLCVGRFINDINFLVIEKNPIENEVDVFASNKIGEKLKFQIVSADPPFYGEIGEHVSMHQKKTIEEKAFSRGNNNVTHVIESIKKKVGLYKKQGKDMSDIILLLDDGIGNMPQSLLEKVKNGNKDVLVNSGFKEIWYVGSSEIFRFV